MLCWVDAQASTALFMTTITQAEILFGLALLSEGKITKWCYPPFEDLLEQAAQTVDIDKRRWLYIQAQRIFKHEQPLTPIAYPIVYQPINKQVTGFKINPFGTTQFAGVGLKEGDEAWQQKD